MKKYALAITICLIAVMVATPVFADIFRITLVPVDIGSGASGKATVNYVKTDIDQGVDKIGVRIHCRRLKPYTNYLVGVVDKTAIDKVQVIGGFTTTGNGVGHFTWVKYLDGKGFDINRFFLVVGFDVLKPILIDKRPPKERI